MRSRRSPHRKRSRNRTDSRRTEILGDYGKSKALGNRSRFWRRRKSGLNASVVCPPASSAPAIWRRAEIPTRMLLAFCRGRLPLGRQRRLLISLTCGMSRLAGVLACAERKGGNATFFPATTRETFRTCLPDMWLPAWPEVPETLRAAALANCAAPIFEKIGSSGVERPLFHTLFHRRCFAHRAFSNVQQWARLFPRPPAQRNAPEHDSLAQGQNSFLLLAKRQCPVLPYFPV